MLFRSDLLTPTDYITSTHRGHGHAIAKGVDPAAMFAELYGRETGVCGGRGGSMHVADFSVGMLGANGIVGGGFGIATGAAFAIKYQNRSDVAVCFFGDGAVNKGTFHEALNFAGVHRLPVLFVCENNLYASYTRIEERQPQRPMHGIAAASGCFTQTVDGHDVEAVLAAAQDAVAHLRSGGEPAFLECATYRWREHCGPDFDDHLGYRPSGELDEQMARCPIRRLSEKLLSMPQGARDAEVAETRIAAEIDAAFARVHQGRIPDPADLAGYVYA